MGSKKNQTERVIIALQERAKELSCLYTVEEILQDFNKNLPVLFNEILQAIPPGWQYPEICQARLTFQGQEFKTTGYKTVEWKQTADILVNEEVVGTIEVSYSVEKPPEDEGPFLKEERKLINTLAERMGQFITHQQLRQIYRDVEAAEAGKKSQTESKIVIDLLYHTDPKLYIRIARRLLNYLHKSNIAAAQKLLRKVIPASYSKISESEAGDNIPSTQKDQPDIMVLSQEIYNIAYAYIGDKQLLAQVQLWVQEDRANLLIKVLNDPKATLNDISDQLRRFRQIADKEKLELPETMQRNIIVQFIRVLMSGGTDFIRIAKRCFSLEDFYDLFHLMIHSAESRGCLGGKGSGLFLASKLLEKEAFHNPELGRIKTPKTFFVTTDGLHEFIHYNDLQEVFEQKYKDIEQIRMEYPQIVDIFKNSKFPPDIVNKASLALDELGDVPLIVRSSSLLEDQLGTAFSGKYRSVFLGNQGTKQERLRALLDAIAEVYASTFSPDPIEYRKERDLLDFQEEMGVLVEEVVGETVGPYFLPAFAGVAFNNNEFRWSPRIVREDGLVRLVPGLGTRAVDRLADDYPILVSPGQPNLRVNVTQDEFIRYSPHKLDVINLETNSFETVELGEFIKEYGADFNAASLMLSVLKDDHLQQLSILDLDFTEAVPVVTFDKLVQATPFIAQIKAILSTLREKFEYAVDIEFASNGKEFYLLQCRPQSYSRDRAPAPIPKDIHDNNIIFNAKKYVSNGHVADIMYVVYVDPDRYSMIESKTTLTEIGRVISKLNLLLPKRQFILMGPGRWGSRGDIKLGISVTYSDINNTAMLIEIARKKGNYVPDLSFGTHFFQDLVESDIHYLPLYPDDKDIIFNQRFLNTPRNILHKLLPEYEYLDHTIKVIDVSHESRGKLLQVFMNGELDEAVGVLAEPAVKSEEVTTRSNFYLHTSTDEHWRWRKRMVDGIAGSLSPEMFGVKALYLFGSTNNGNAGPGSDIDLLVHFDGKEEQKRDLIHWLDGWSRCLDEMNYSKTGYRSGGLLDIHLITEEDIKNKRWDAAKIGAATDPASEIPLTFRDSAKADGE